MAPKTKITRQMIVEAGFDIVRRQGYEHLNARAIAEALGCSTQPVLYSFRTVDEIREAVYRAADEFHTAYIMPGEADGDPFLALGLNYIRFGSEERELFRFLFQTNHFRGQNTRSLLEGPDVEAILALLSRSAGCGAEAAREIFLMFFFVAHGQASLLANNAMPYDEQQARAALEGLFNAMIPAKRD